MNLSAKPIPQTDLRNFRLRNINQQEYRHMWFLLFWPIFCIRYLVLENIDPIGQFHLIHCALDDAIPFNEWFLIPYALWYLGIIGMHLYTMVYDVESFRKYSKFLMISMGISTATFILYPSYQDLRPDVFLRDNVLTQIVGYLYQIDTSTNIFPSEHAIGAIAVFCAYLHTKGIQTPGRTAVVAVVTVLICLSTVFLKQHSVLDVLAALPVCAITYIFCYGKEYLLKARKEKNDAL